MKAIISQFGHPRGFLGTLAGAIMARSNAARYDWAISLLDPQPSERVLEIGFGPGVGIQNWPDGSIPAW